MAKITLIKKYRNTETLRQLELSEVVSIIRSCLYQGEVEQLRRLSFVEALAHQDDETIVSVSATPLSLPRVCFASELEHHKGERLNRGYTGLALLEVNNLGSYDEAVAVRRGAGQMPQTLLAFVGASGLSVKIVVRGELLQEGGGLPSGADDTRRFHLNLYEKARLVYNAQLGVTIDKLEPRLDRSCFVGADAGLVYNPAAVTLYTDTSELGSALRPVAPAGGQPDEIVPGHDRYHSLRLIYEYNLTKAYDETLAIADSEERLLMVITRLAEHCCDTGLDMGFAQRQALLSVRLGGEPDVVRQAFENAYRVEHERQYRRRLNVARPLKNIPPETLLTMKIDMFLNANYELRKNVMRGVAEYRVRTGLGFQFQDLTEEARNSITMQAMSQGIKCWDKDIRRYVNSNNIALYDPMDDFLEHLPHWDGRDRVTPLAQRVHTDYAEWPHLFNIWMRSMVAMWKGKGQLSGNALVPLLIGRQGCGKSSFCRILLPRELREYYNDRISFKNEQDLNLGLTSFALINLDEFDKITSRQQIVLKYLVSTADLKYRPPYGKAYSSHRRYASFIGTTNESAPLTDPSGSRRFVCVTVEGNIDFQAPVEYAQLYAQLKHEVEVERQRYFLTKDEEAALMRHNQLYQKLNGLGEMLLSLFERPEASPSAAPDGGQWLSLKDISARLKQAYGSAYREDERALVNIGSFLSRQEYKFVSRRKTTGMTYWMKERQ